ncbi:TPA: hypothetical protein ACH3X2_003653 [Trebouxia sp. C0005]
MPWAVEVWYDAPAAPMQLNALPDSQRLLTTFAGRVAGQFARVLIDTGATDHYVDAAFATANALHVIRCDGHVLAAGKERIAVHDYVKARVSIQSLAEDVKLHVVDLPGNSLQAVLGQSWLREHSAIISYIDSCVMYFSGNRQRRLCFSPDAPDLPSCQ